MSIGDPNVYHALSSMTHPQIEQGRSSLNGTFHQSEIEQSQSNGQELLETEL